MPPTSYKLSLSDHAYFEAFYREAFVGKTYSFCTTTSSMYGYQLYPKYYAHDKNLAIILRNGRLPLQTIPTLAHYHPYLNIRSSMSNTI